MAVSLSSPIQIHFLQRIVLWIIFAAGVVFQPVVVVQADQRELTVFAASSLADVLDELGQVFSEQYGVDVLLNYAGTATLVTQIENGAQADVFASANLPLMQVLTDQQLIDPQQVSIFAANELVLLVPAENAAAIESAHDLAREGVLLVAAAPGVPVRDYTEQLLRDLTGLYGAGFHDAVTANIISEESNVRQSVSKIVLGVADATFAYRTDITPDIRDEVRIIDLPVASPRVRYPIAPLQSASNSEDAVAFIRFIHSEQGQQILTKWGFLLPNCSEAGPAFS